MKKIIASLAALGMLALPAAAGASHHRLYRAVGVGAAAKACKTERQADVAAFRTKYANRNGRHAFRRCVRRHVRQARATCRAERQADVSAFRTKYANKKGRHAFRRCVRGHAGDPIS